MQHIRNSVLKHLRVSYYKPPCLFSYFGKSQNGPARHMCASATLSNANLTMARVVGLVKKFGKIDGNKVTETADFQKDLCLDSLDRVDLVMALEQEFSIEIPNEIADKLASCADVAKYIESECKNSERSC